MKFTIDASTIHGGGGLEHLKYLVRYLLKKKHKVNLICPNHLKNYFDSKNLKTYFVKSNSLCLIFFYLFYSHKFNSGYYLSLNGIFIPNNCRGIIFFHNLLIFDDLELSRHNYSIFNIKAKILRFLFKKNYKKSQKAIFFSKTSKKIIGKVIPLNKEKDFVVHHGLNQNFFYNRKKNKLIDKVKLIYPSSLLYYKNHFQLLNAIKDFKHDNIKIELYFLGQKFQFIENFLRRFHINNPNISYHYLGNLNFKFQINIFKKMDAVIFPSSCETFGLSLYEAAISGLPVICSNKFTCKEIIESNAFYFNPFDEKSITRALFKFINNQEQAHLYSHSCQSILKKFKWNDQIKKTINLILTLQ